MSRYAKALMMKTMKNCGPSQHDVAGRLSYHYMLLLGLTICAGAAWWLYFRLYTDIMLEDALITYRYASNIAMGKGFVYNQGERVLGSTTPLLTLLLALLGKVFGVVNIPTISFILLSSLGILTGPLNYLILRQLDVSRFTAIVGVILFYGNRDIMITAVGGMETPLVLFLMALSYYFLMGRRYTPGLVACAALILTRIDGVIWAALVFAVMCLREKRVMIKPVILPAIILAPWFIFSWAYFGALLPNTIEAKRVIGNTVGGIFSYHTACAFGEWYGWTLLLYFGKKLVLCTILPIAAGCRRLVSGWRALPFGLIPVLFPLAYGAFLYLGKAPYFPWYLLPAIWCSLLLISMGFEEIIRFCVKVFPRPYSAPLFRGVLLAFVVFVLFFVHNKGILDHSYKYQSNEYSTRKTIGLWLRDNTPPGSAVAMEAIGYQGYYSNRRIVDFAGLVSPRVVDIRKRSRSNAEAFYGILRTLEPDYLVLRSFEVDRNMHFHGGPLFENREQRAFFMDHYGEIKRFIAPYPEVWGEYAGLVIYKKKTGSRPEASGSVEGRTGR